MGADPSSCARSAPRRALQKLFGEDFLLFFLNAACTQKAALCAHVQLLHHMTREHVKILYNRICSCNHRALLDFTTASSQDAVLSDRPPPPSPPFLERVNSPQKRPGISLLLWRDGLGQDLRLSNLHYFLWLVSLSLLGAGLCAQKCHPLIILELTGPIASFKLNKMNNLNSYLVIVVDVYPDMLCPSLEQTALNAELRYVSWQQYLKYYQIMDHIIAQI